MHCTALGPFIWTKLHLKQYKTTGLAMLQMSKASVSASARNTKCASMFEKVQKN